MRTIEVSGATAKIFGRTLTDAGTLWLIHSASGFECTVTAKTLSVTLTGDSTAHPTEQADGKPEMNWARFALYVDGTETFVGTMDKAQKTVTVFSGSEVRTATVMLIKLTESSQSYIGVSGLTADDDAVLRPASYRPLRIEFIGDSITCGYGVEGKTAEEPFTTQTENATKAYAYLAAKKLGADWSLVSFSGFGILSGWAGDGNRNPTMLVPDHYERPCFSWNTGMHKEHVWDFGTFRPQLVVLNLGTNDDSYTRDDKEKQMQYVSDYVEFLRTVRLHNPSAHILLTLGIMTGGNRLIPFMERAAAEYTKLTGDGNISTMRFLSQTDEEGFGSDWHPSAATQARCADDLARHIRSLIDDGTVRVEPDGTIIRELVRSAGRMLRRSYAPYSGYQVGAALLTKQGGIYTGCNIENVAYGPSNCAERTAFFKALADGKNQFAAIAITGGPHGNVQDYCTPCGVCRQVMAEFCTSDFLVIMAKSESDYKTRTLGELLPESFGPQGAVGLTAVS